MLVIDRLTATHLGSHVCCMQAFCGMLQGSQVMADCAIAELRAVFELQAGMLKVGSAGGRRLGISQVSGGLHQTCLLRKMNHRLSSLPPPFGAEPAAAASDAAVDSCKALHPR